MAVIQKDLGPVTAYAAAVSAGYTGTKEEFEALMASYATVAQNAAASATAAASSALQAEGWASGTQGGVDVDSESPYYHKDAEYLADQANQASTAASTNALKAEGWAAGTQNGTAVPQNSPYYHNDAAYLAGRADASADAAAESATNAETSALKAEGFTEGTQNGTAVGSSSEYYQHNMKYYKEHIDSVQASIPLEYDELSADVVQLQEDMENKAEIDGYYEGMTVGDAEQLVSTMYEEDKGIYNFRTSGGSVDIGNREQEMIVGGTVCWNQLCPSMSESRTTVGLTITNNNNKSITITGTINSATNFRIQGSTGNVALKNGHKYLYSIGGTLPSGVYIYIGSIVFPTSSVEGIINIATDSTGTFNLNSANSNVAFNSTYIPQIFDLTQMFGSTIADYVYSLEQANAGAGVAWFRKLFPKPYYAYNAGELMSVKALKHQMTGFNQWDEEWEVGAYGNNGEKVSNSNVMRTKNKIPVLPNTTYCLNIPIITNLTYRRIFWDKNEQCISSIAGYDPRQQTFTTPSNAYYMALNLGAEYGTTYNHDICINLSWSGYRNGEYEPYELHTVELDPDLELRGIPKLDEDNHLVYDGDTYESDGKVTRKYGIVDLGTLTWTYNASTFGGTFSTANVSAHNSITGNCLCSRYTTVYASSDITNTDKTIYAKNNGTMIYVKDSSYSDAAAFKTAMSGVMLVYERVTPTEETAEIYANPQWVNDFGTEEYVDAGVEAGTRDVAIPVGHETKYTANLRDKLQHLPDTAEEDGQYLIKQESKQMRLVKDTKAEVDGYYEELTAGSAEQLISSQLNNDQEPYVFRTAGGSADIGNRKNESVVGGTICWNQYLNKNEYEATKTVNGIAFTNNGDGSVTANGTATETTAFVLKLKTEPNADIIIGHKYLFISGLSEVGSSTTFEVMVVGSGGANVNIYTGAKIVNAVASWYRWQFAVRSGTTVTNLKCRPMFFDLTQMFGSTIADYVYSLEQATAGAGVAWFRKLFPKPYYEYNAGELMSVKAAAMETVGFNQWDGEQESGAIDTSTGNNSPSSGNFRSKNYVPVIPNTTYCYSNPKVATGIRAIFYDANKNYIGARTNGNPNPQTFTTPANAAYMRFYWGDISEVCLNLSWSGYRNGEYEPYVKRTYPLDSSLELRGIPKLSADNTMYFDGDTYEPDGTVTRRYGVVDLGTLTWGLDGTGAHRAYGKIEGIKVPSSVLQKANVVTQNSYKQLSASGTLAAEGEFAIVNTGAGQNFNIVFYYTGTAPTGYMVYELAEPTTEEAEPFQSPQIVDDFGTERFIDAAYEAEERDVAIPVGHNTDYMVNLRDKLQHLPDLADGNGTYVVVQNNNQLSLTPLTTPTELPEAPTTNGTYTLKVTVADGTPTYSWVSG